MVWGIWDSVGSGLVNHMAHLDLCVLVSDGDGDLVLDWGRGTVLAFVYTLSTAVCVVQCMWQCCVQGHCNVWRPMASCYILVKVPFISDCPLHVDLTFDSLTGFPLHYFAWSFLSDQMAHGSDIVCEPPRHNGCLPTVFQGHMAACQLAGNQCWNGSAKPLSG